MNTVRANKTLLFFTLFFDFSRRFQQYYYTFKYNIFIFFYNNYSAYSRFSVVHTIFIITLKNNSTKFYSSFFPFCILITQYSIVRNRRRNIINNCSGTFSLNGRRYNICCILLQRRL